MSHSRLPAHRRSQTQLIEPLEGRTLFTTVSVAPISVSESSGEATFTATLNAASVGDVTINYSTVNGTAKAGVDYEQTKSSTTILAGETAATFSVQLIDNDTYKPNDDFFVALSASGAKVSTHRVKATIITDNPIPTVSIDDTSVSLPDTGASDYADAIVTLSNPTSSNVSVKYTSADGSAVAKSDYRRTAGTLAIKAGQTSGTIKVKVIGAGSSESGETFQIDLLSARNATLPTGTFSTVTIGETQATTPTLAIADASITEGTSGTQTLDFTVTLSAASSEAVTVAYATADGTASAGTNYTATSGTLTFAEGVTSQTIPVTIIDNSAAAASSTVSVNLSGPTNATLAAASATGTILNSSATGTTDLSDNLSQTSGGTETADSSDYLTASFTTGSTVVSLQSVTLLLAGSGTASVAIYTDGGLQPGTLVGTLTSPSSYSSTLAQTIFSASGISLMANTTYWVVLKPTSGSFTWSWTNSNTGSGAGFTGVWGSSADAGTTWFTDDAYPLQMSVVVA